jgi:hypothetical protein
VRSCPANLKSAAGEEGRGRKNNPVPLRGAQNDLAQHLGAQNSPAQHLGAQNNPAQHLGAQNNPAQHRGSAHPLTGGGGAHRAGCGQHVRERLHGFVVAAGL